MNSIQLKNINKSFNNKRILDSIDLDVKNGEMISLFGSSGCGKTTLLKVVAGLLTPDEGDVLINGESVVKVPTDKRGAVIVFQDHLLFPHLNVEDNVGFGLKMTGMNRNDRAKRVSELLELMELSGLEKRYPSEISGGQRQRAALARALAVNPKVLLLDEPFSNLDMRLRENMRDFVYELQKKLRITTILVTHDKQEAFMMSDRIAVMLDGRITQLASPYDVYNNPASKKIADLFGQRNYLKGKLENGSFICELGEFHVMSEKKGEVFAMFKVEDIKINRHQGLKGVIKKIRYTGDSIYYVVSMEYGEFTCLGDMKTSFSKGENVYLELNFENAVFLID